MIFFNPFFFLLLDSFFLSLSDSLLVSPPAACAESALVPPSLVWPSAAAAPSVFAAASVVRVPSPVPSVFGGSLLPAAVGAFAGSLAGVDAAKSGCYA